MVEPAFLYDDAYITLASAQALWAGHDPVFRGTPPLQGITSPFHCLVVAALLALMPPAWALLCSCLIGAVAYGWGLWAVGRYEGLTPSEAVALVVVGLGAGMTSQHLVNGLETSWTLAWVTWFMWAVRRNEQLALALLAGTGAFIRPELAVLAAVGIGYAAWLRPTSSLRLLAVSGLAALPWLIWLWTSLGSPIPTSLAAKRDWYAEACWQATHRVSTVIRGLAGWLSLMPLVATGLIGLLRTMWGGLCLAWAIVVLICFAWSVPNVLLSYQRHRYHSLYLPLLLWGLTQSPRWIRFPTIVGALLWALVSTAGVIRYEPDTIAKAMHVRRQLTQALEHARPGRVLLHDAGYLAYSRTIQDGVDMVGLKSPVAAALHAKLTAPSCGLQRERAIVILTASTRPTHLVIWQPWDRHFGVTEALADSGWTVAKEHATSTTNPIVLYSLKPPP